MLIPLDVVVVPVEQMLLFYFAIMGEAAGIVLMFLIFLHLRYYRLGPLGKAELGNKRGEIGIVRQQRGIGYVIKLKEMVKGVLVGNDRHVWATAPNTVTHIKNGPGVYFIDAESGQAVPPIVANIAEALNNGEYKGIESRDVNHLADEFAEKWFYPSYNYQWSTTDLSAENRNKVKADNPSAYEDWRQRRMADLKSYYAFEVRKRNELSEWAEITRGIRRQITTYTGFTGAEPDDIKLVGMETKLAQEKLSDIEINNHRIGMIYIAAQTEGTATPISAIAHWNINTPEQAIMEAYSMYFLKTIFIL